MATAKKSTVFETLNAINVTEHLEKKGKLTYLSWAWAWSITKEKYPSTTYTVYENINGMNYHNDGMSAWVKVGVTIEEMEHIEYLPIMDFKNKSIVLSALTSMDVNKAIQRALTKAIARHGLGLYIYAGEDLPEADKPNNNLISDAQHQELRKLLQDKGLDYMSVCEGWNFKQLSELQEASIVNFRDWVNTQNVNPS